MKSITLCLIAALAMHSAIAQVSSKGSLVHPFYLYTQQEVFDDWIKDDSVIGKWRLVNYKVIRNKKYVDYRTRNNLKDVEHFVFAADGKFYIERKNKGSNPDTLIWKSFPGAIDFFERIPEEDLFKKREMYGVVRKKNMKKLILIANSPYFTPTGETITLVLHFKREN